jgi:hypothetical protein|tara:strand:+ start:6090 stop:6509 length:420 start_codon:yes stop_codon:yes gene_type:complete
MIVVAGVWEQGWFDYKTELNLWYYPLKDFGVDEFAMTPISGVELNNKVREFKNVEDIIQYYNLPVILCTEHGESTLEEFEHPKDALYLFNRTSGGIIVNKPDYSLKIETNLNKGMLWGHQAASIILYDKFIKNGNINKR